MSSSEAYAALCRTAQLLRLDVFESDPACDPQIADGLRATTVRIIADRPTARSRGGQTAITTLYGQLAMTGLQIDLDIPDVEVAGPQPPLRHDRLVDGLLEYSRDLIPGGSSNGSERPELVFAVGDTPAAGAHVRLTWADDRAMVVPAKHPVAAPSGDELPFGALAAAAAAASEGVRAAVPIIADRLGVQLPDRPAWLNPGTRRIMVDLGALLGGVETRLGDVDAISGGAITTACLYTLLRFPRLTGHLRVIEADILDLSNLNRYALARRSLVGCRKTAALSTYSTRRFEIVGDPRCFDASTVASLQPLATRVLVGVDHIPSRWIAQQHTLDRRLLVGATSHDFVLMTEHERGTACAGCAHPKDDATSGPIPTIGFVSLWAGILQAARLLCEPSQSGRGIEVWPLGLDNPRGIRTYAPSPIRQCPIGCLASQEAHRRAG